MHVAGLIRFNRGTTFAFAHSRCDVSYALLHSEVTGDRSKFTNSKIQTYSESQTPIDPRRTVRLGYEITFSFPGWHPQELICWHVLSSLS